MMIARAVTSSSNFFMLFLPPSCSPLPLAFKSLVVVFMEENGMNIVVATSLSIPYVVLSSSQLKELMSPANRLKITKEVLFHIGLACEIMLLSIDKHVLYDDLM